MPTKVSFSVSSDTSFCANGTNSYLHVKYTEYFRTEQATHATPFLCTPPFDELCPSFIQGPPQEGQTVCSPTFSPGRSGARNIFYRLFLSYHSTRFAARRTDNMLSDLSPGHSGAEKMCAEKALYRKSLKHFLATLFVRPSSCFKEAKALTTLDFSGTAGCYRFFPITLFCPISPQKKIPAFLAENRYSKNASDSA